MQSFPKPIDLIIEARWIAPVEPNIILENHAVAINDGHIVAILPTHEALQQYQAQEHTVLTKHILIPGLINLHTHAAMSLMRGLADDLPLATWLEQRIWPTEAQHLSQQFVLDGTRLACAEMLKGGITCFNDMYFFPEAAAQAASELGMRAALGITTLEFPNAYAADADDYIDKGLAVREQCLNNPLISFCLAPHAPYSVANKTFERILMLSEQLNLPIHCHLHETASEIEEGLEKFGKRPLEHLVDLGIPGAAFIGVHAVHLNDRDYQILADTGSSIAHCPSSNLKLASGIANVVKMQQCGINVGLGTDSAASNNRLDLFMEMRLAALLAKGTSGDASVLPAHEVLRMATLNAAYALGLEDKIGSIRLGKAADLCAVSLHSIECQPCFDPLSHLIHVASRDCVTHVWVAGKCCVEGKKIISNQLNGLETSVALWQNRLEVRWGANVSG